MSLAMLIFMDESGDTGFNFKRVASPYFVLTIVIFDDLDAAEKANDAINQLKKDLKFHPGREFKFSTGTSNHEKEVFLRKLSRFDFHYRSVIIDKTKLLKREPLNPTDSLYMLVADQLFMRAQNRINHASLFVDLTSKHFIREFNGYLRKKLNTDIEKLLGQIRHKDSKSNNLLQLADMVCGAIYRKYNRNDDTFYKLIKKREEDLWKPY